MSDKRDVVKNLKNGSVDREVILAADDDREGEAIAWHTKRLKILIVKDIALYLGRYQKKRF